MNFRKSIAAFFATSLILDSSLLMASSEGDPTQTSSSSSALVRVLDCANKDASVGKVYDQFRFGVQALIGNGVDIADFDMITGVVCAGFKDSDPRIGFKETSLASNREILKSKLSAAVTLPADHQANILMAYDCIVAHYLTSTQKVVDQIRAVYDSFLKVLPSDGKRPRTTRYGVMQGGLGGSMQILDGQAHLQLLTCNKLGKLQHAFWGWKHNVYVSPVLSLGDDYTLAAFVFGCDRILMRSGEEAGINPIRLRLLQVMGRGEDDKIIELEGQLKAMQPDDCPVGAFGFSELHEHKEGGEVIKLTASEMDEVLRLDAGLPKETRKRLTTDDYERLEELRRPEIWGQFRAFFDKMECEFSEGADLARKRTQAREERELAQKEAERKAKEAKEAIERQKFEHLMFTADDRQAFGAMNAAVQEILREKNEAVKKQSKAAQRDYLAEGVMVYGYTVYSAHNQEAQRIVDDQLTKRGIDPKALKVTTDNVDQTLKTLENWMLPLITVRGIGGPKMQEDVRSALYSFSKVYVKTDSYHQEFFRALMVLHALDGYYQSFSNGSEKKNINGEFVNVLASAMCKTIEHKDRCNVGAKGRTFLTYQEIIAFLDGISIQESKA